MTYRKLAAILGALGILLPLGGHLQLALGERVPKLAVRANAEWLIDLRTLVIASACVVVLALTAALRYQDDDRPDRLH